MEEHEHALGILSEPGDRPVSVHLERMFRRLLLTVVWAEVLLVTLDIVVNWKEVVADRRIQDLFNMAQEENIPTWFSSVQLLLVGLTLLVTGRIRRARGAGWAERLGWCLFGLFFVFLSADETGTIHETIGSWLGDLGRAPDGAHSGLEGWLAGLGTYDWHRFVMPIYALVGVLFFFFMRKKLSRHGLLKLFVAGGILFALAQGLDYVEGIENANEDSKVAVYLQEKLGVAELYDVSHALALLEEALELFGVTLVWYALLRHLAHAGDGLRLTLVRRDARPAD